MLDPKLLRDSPDAIRTMLERRNLADYPLDELITLDKQRRQLMSNSQELRKRKNQLSEKIASKKKNREDAAQELEEMKVTGSEMKVTEDALAVAEQKFNELMLRLPNLLDESVPVGIDEKANVIVRQVGSAPTFMFTPRDHVEISISQDLVDFERAAKVSGARFYYLKNDLVRLNQALINLALDFLSENGCSPVQPPYMIRQKAMEGAVILSDFKDVIYKIADEDLYLIGTSEHAIASMHMDEILEGTRLPIRYAGYSSCFRKEAGAHGKDMKGIFRVHQFEKVEQFTFCRPEESWEEHERMLRLAEKFVQLLGIPYRLILLSSGDTGKISCKTYDIEAWMPGQGAYREIISCSNCLDYQARRLSIRFRDRTNEDTRLLHTLNSTLVATERTLVAIMENYQKSDGTFAVPEALQKYMGGKTLIGNPK